MLNLPHNSYPPISSFDESRIRKMIIQCSKIGPGPPDFSVGQIRHHSQICYMRSIWDSKTDAKYDDNPQPVSVGTSSFLTNIPTPSEFCSILKSNYPQLAHSKLGILLNQHNAVSFKSCNELKRSVHEENTRFLHSLLSTLSKSCICCTLHGTTCIAQELQPPESPLLSNLYRHSKQQSKSEGATSAAPKDKHKAANSSYTINEVTPSHKKSRINSYDADDDVTPKITKLHQPTEESKCWADSLIGGILMFTDETDPPEDVVVFAQISPFKPTPVSTLHTSYADSHWTDGRLHIHPPPDVLIAIHSYFRNHPPSELSRPRYCSLAGKTIVDQLYGSKLLDHEIDNKLLYPGSTPKWRCYIEADFSV
ncbi:hypothetical protein VPH35_125870 [Triticum aestivum]